MKTTMITCVLLALCFSVSAQTEYDVKAKDGKPMLVQTTGKEVKETPISSKALAEDYKNIDAQLKATTERRDQLAEIVRLNEQIVLLNEQKTILADLFERAKAIEKSLEPKPDKP